MTYLRSILSAVAYSLLACLAVVSVQTSATVSDVKQEIELNVALGQPIMLAGQQQKAYLKIGLTGLDDGNIQARPPINLSIVLDKSGSMQGQKMAQAKDAAVMAIQRLSNNDIVSIVTYDDTVEVVWPATRVTDKNAIIRAIQRIDANGSTALFSGVSKGAGEVRKFLETQMVNRVILLSDGLANVGPSTPQELGQLGMSLGKEGISVTTIGLGLGYNEDLMTDLAGYSDGNHSFAENATDLAQIFDRELENALSVVANGAVITIYCNNGVKPLRVIGREAEIIGQTVKIKIGQLYRAQEKYVLLEVDVSSNDDGSQQSIADVDVSYDDIFNGRSEKLVAKANVSFSTSADRVKKNTNNEVMVSTVEQIAVEKSKEAILLRDEGKIEQAEAALGAVGDYLSTNAASLKSDKLRQQAVEAEEDAKQLDDKDWNLNRKKLKEKEYTRSKQSYK